jgi:hypothetical protein
MPLSVAQLSTLLGKTDSVTSPYYRGCYRLTELDKLEPLLDLNDKNVICFIHDAHFFGLFLYPAQARSVFIDSVQVYPNYYGNEIMEFLNYYCPNYKTLPFRVQGPYSKLCGLYIEYFHHQFCGDKSIDQAMKPFRPAAYSQNDNILRLWTERTFSSTD